VGESEIHLGQVAGIAELRSTDSRIAGLRSGGGFVSGAQAGRYFSEMSRLRGKRSAGQSESGRDSPKVESREVVPKKEDENKNVHSPSNRHKYLLRYLPEDERLHLYMEAPNRIFAEHQLSGMRLARRQGSASG